MKKIMYAAGSALTLFVLGIVIFLFFNYHSTAEGALEELEEKQEGHVFPLTGNTLALVVDPNGAVSVARSNVLRPSSLYSDFKVYPTALNIKDIGSGKEIAYANSPKDDGLSIGLVKNDRVKFVSNSPYNLHDNAMEVFSLEDYFGNGEAKDVKLWYAYTFLDETNPADQLSFLDGDMEILTIPDN